MHDVVAVLADEDDDDDGEWLSPTVYMRPRVPQRMVFTDERLL